MDSVSGVALGRLQWVLSLQRVMRGHRGNAGIHSGFQEEVGRGRRQNCRLRSFIIDPDPRTNDHLDLDWSLLEPPRFPFLPLLSTVLRAGSLGIRGLGC